MTPDLRKLHSTRPLVAALALVLNLSIALPVCAQAVVATVNDSPVTDYDIEQRAKLHRVLKLPFTKDIAVEGIIEDRLKIIETKKYKIQPGEAEVVDAIGRVAQEMKIPTEALSAQMQKAGVSADHVREHFGAQYAWKIYARSMNKTLDISERKIRQELEKRGLKGGVEYTLRQIFFVVAAGSNEASVKSRMREAEALRNRFTDCSTGPQMAIQYTDVVVKDPVVRTGSAFPPAFARELDSTPVGRVTRPQRVQSGIEMLAICRKGPARDADESAADTIRQELLEKRFEQEGDKLYRRVRARAVVAKR